MVPAQSVGTIKMPHAWSGRSAFRWAALRFSREFFDAQQKLTTTQQKLRG
jgi:hypothetical protein